MIKLKVPQTKFLVVLAITILLISGVAWFDLIRNNEKRVFERMLSTSLSSNSVTKQVSQTEGTQILNQTVQVTTAPITQAHQKNVLQQGKRATITTESISKPDVDFVRYLNIETEELNSKGEKFDFSSVLGDWGVSEVAEDPTNSQAEIYEQSLLGIVPISKLSPNNRQHILNIIRENNIYQVDYSSVTKSAFYKRPVYTYEVTVSPEAYIKFLKSYAEAVGLRSLVSIDSSQYASAPPIKFKFEVDVWSSQLNKITYVDSGRTETFSAYGARVVVDEPENPGTIEELQTKLQLIN